MGDLAIDHRGDYIDRYAEDIPSEKPNNDDDSDSEIVLRIAESDVSPNEVREEVSTGIDTINYSVTVDVSR